MMDQAKPPLLDVLVVNYNTSTLLQPMFDACEKAAVGLEVRYWVVDNASRDDSVEMIRSKYPHVGLEVNTRNVGFGRANNQLLKYVRGDYVLLLNTDAFVSPDTLTKTLAYMQANPECGVLGVKLIGRDGVLQPSCRHFPTPWNSFLAHTGLSRFFPRAQMIDDMTWDHMSVRECDWVTGCYYLVRREAIDKVGLFDPRFFLYCEEVDHCKRVKEGGWKVIFFPETTVVHIGGESAKTAENYSSDTRQISELQVESEMLYFRKHYKHPGLLAHVLLSLVADIYLIAKSCVKMRGLQSARTNFAHSALLLKTLYKTRMASRSTK